MKSINQAMTLIQGEGLLAFISSMLRRYNLYGSFTGVLKYWLRRMMGHKIVVSDILCSKMMLDIGAGGVHSELYINGIREIPATTYYLGLLNPNMVVVDIGANIGYYALLGARKCKYVYAIEPAPENFEMLCSNIDMNSYQNIDTFNLAIGDREGDVKFKLSSIPNWHRIATNGDGDLTIPMKTLDSFLDGKRADYIRMDVEGYELNILKGMSKTIAMNNLGLFIETHHKLLEDYGGSIREFYELLADYEFTLKYSWIKGKEGLTGSMKRLLNQPMMYEGLGSWLFLERRV